MKTYLVHDFTVESPWALPEGVLEHTVVGGPSGIWVNEGPVEWEPDPEGPIEQYARRGKDHFFYWRMFGKVRIRADGEVTLAPHEAAPRGIIGHAILGPICAHWILLIGGVPLHSNCVAVAGELLGVVGESGSGKSTMAAALVSRGAVPHGDDVIFVRPGTAEVPFGTARIKLNPDVIEGIELPMIGVSPIYEGLEKKSVLFAYPSDLSSRPIKAIYRLRDADRAAEFVEVKKFPAAAAILSEIYRPHVAEQAIGLQAMLQRAASLVGKVRVFDFYRRRDLTRIEQSADELIEHFQSLG